MSEEATRRIQHLLEENNRTEMKRRDLALRVRELEATVLALQRELVRVQEDSEGGKGS
mgnify:CR=1 FL=1